MDNLVFKPIVYLGSTKLAKPVVSSASKAIQGLSRYALSNTARLLASGLGGKFIKQLPDFKEWRLYSVTSPNKEEVGLKRLDNFLSYFRSFGKAPKDIEGISEQVMLFVKSKARKLDRTMEGLERKAYDMAKKFQNNYDEATSSPALQKHYLDQVEEFLRGQLKKEDLPKEFQALAVDLKNLAY